MKNLVFFSILLTQLFIGVVNAEVYKWVDSDGNVHFGDRPDENTKAEKIDIKPPNLMHADPLATSKNEIISYQISYDGPRTLGIDITYHYTGEQGDDAWLGAITTTHGQSTGYWSYRPFKMKRGTDTQRVVVNLNEKVAPKYHCTDGLVFSMYARDISTFHEAKVRYRKCWHKTPPSSNPKRIEIEPKQKATAGTESDD